MSWRRVEPEVWARETLAAGDADILVRLGMRYVALATPGEPETPEMAMLREAGEMIIVLRDEVTRLKAASR
jgi:hypothetical protein